MGSLELITGCMFSGKTTDLFRRLRLAQLSRPHEPIIVYRPSLDTRSSAAQTHDGVTYTSVTCPDSQTLLDHVTEHHSMRVLGIDELQFFDDGLISACKLLRAKGLRVLATGLNQDFRGEPFRFRDSVLDIGHLIALANIHHPMQDAVCMFPLNDHICGSTAYCTQRLYLDGTPVPYTDPLVHPGGKDPSNNRRYEARCFQHHIVPGRPW